jgi:hypothetical protein
MGDSRSKGKEIEVNIKIHKSKKDFKKLQKSTSLALVLSTYLT